MLGLFGLYGRPWDEALIQSRHPRSGGDDAAPEDVDFPEAEIDDDERRAAIARERHRRFMRGRER